VEFVVGKVALGQLFSEYFGFPCQSSFHQLLHNHPHLSSGAGKIGKKWPQCKGLSLTPLAIKELITRSKNVQCRFNGTNYIFRMSMKLSPSDYHVWYELTTINGQHYKESFESWSHCNKELKICGLSNHRKTSDQKSKTLSLGVIDSTRIQIKI
jgi:hypothetical protein